MKKSIKRYVSSVLAVLLIAAVPAAGFQAADINTDNTSVTDRVSDSAFGYSEISATEFVDATEPVDPTEASEHTEVPDPAVEMSFDNTPDGTLVSWKAVEKAAKYALYLRDGEKYKLLTITDKLSFEHKPLENRTLYNYNIKVLDSEDKVFVDYSDADYTNKFIAPPVIESIKDTSEGVELSWNDCSAERYRVYRAEVNSGWSRVGETEGTSYVDKPRFRVPSILIPSDVLPPTVKALQAIITKAGRFSLLPHLQSAP